VDELDIDAVEKNLGGFADDDAKTNLFVAVAVACDCLNVDFALGY
jgi:hypothetical protein